MITNQPKNFWDVVSTQPDWMEYVYPKRNDTEADEEGRLEADKILVYATKLDVCVDYGCGVGRVSKNFKKYTPRMIGLDICKKFIEIARGRDKESEYFSTEEFKERDVADFIFCLSVLQHNTLENRRVIMQEIFDILKSGGIAYITFAAGNVYKESEFIHKFTTPEILDLAKQFSFTRVEDGNLIRYWGHASPPGFNEKILIAIK